MRIGHRQIEVRAGYAENLAAHRRGLALTIAAAILAAVLPALAGRTLRALRVPAPFYTLTCDTSGLPDAYVAPYLAAVRRAVDRWNQAAPQRLFAWRDAGHAQILIRFVPSLEEACGDINASPRGAPHPYVIRLAVLEWGELGYPVPHAPQNIEQIMAHELGHALGCEHAPDPQNVMSSDQHWPWGLPAKRLPDRRDWWPPKRLRSPGPDRKSRERLGPPEWSDGAPNEQALALLWKGDEIYLKGHRLAALPLYDRAVAACPRWTGARVRRAQAHLYLGPVDGLRAVLQDRHALPHSAALASILLQFYSRLDPSEGVKQAQPLLPEFGRSAMVLTSYADCLQRNHDDRRAEAVLNQALAGDASQTMRAAIYRRLARIQDPAREGVTRELPYLEGAASAIGRDGAREQTELGMALWRLGRYSEALPHLRAAVRVYPGDGAATLAAADCCFWLGRQSEARDWLARYRPLSESPPDDALARHLEARLPSAPGRLAALPVGLLLLLALPLMAAGCFLAVRRDGLAAILMPIPPAPWPRPALRLALAGIGVALAACLWLVFLTGGGQCSEILALLTGLLLAAGVAFAGGQHVAGLANRLRALEADLPAPGGGAALDPSHRSPSDGKEVAPGTPFEAPDVSDLSDASDRFEPPANSHAAQSRQPHTDVPG